MNNAFAVKGLRKRLSETEAVIETSFSVRRGELLGLLDPCGAGKTSTINLPFKTSAWERFPSHFLQEHPESAIFRQCEDEYQQKRGVFYSH